MVCIYKRISRPESSISGNTQLSNATIRNTNNIHIIPRGLRSAGRRIRVNTTSVAPKINDAENKPKSRKISVALTKSNMINICRYWKVGDLIN